MFTRQNINSQLIDITKVGKLVINIKLQI